MVVTIVVLLILAGVSIAMLAGEDGIIRQAQNAKDKTEKAEIEEKVRLAINASRINGYGNIDTTELQKELEKLDWDGDVTAGLPATGKINGMDVTIEADGDVTVTEGTLSDDDNNNDDTIVADDLGIMPKINTEEMTPVKYDTATGKWVPADTTVKGDWFDYSASAKKWANVETENGYFVYIPRFAYKITSGYHQSLTNAGTMAVVFLNGDNTLKTTTDSEGNTVSQSDLIHASEVTSSVDETNNEVKTGKNATTNYIIHPAFESFDTAEKKVDGLWVAKYEMSREDKQEDGTWKQTTKTGDVQTGENIRMVSKPGVSSWRSIQVTNIFTNCYNMNRELDSHMMKNTEWGAVAYLTVSKYGKGATSEVEQNKSSLYLTGYGADSTLSTGAASTTGTMYGIFDMSGGTYEYVAGYLDDECMQKTETTTGSCYGYNKSLIEETNTKYKDVYSIGTTNSYTDSYTANNLKVGDGIWEVTSNTGSEYGWYGDHSRFVGLYYGTLFPVFLRGGYYYNDSDTKSGVFYAFGYYGDSNGNDSFRAVCVVQ